MPLFTDHTMQTHRIGGSNYSFSARRIDELGAAEYTLGLIIVDVSGSVEPFSQQIEAAVKTVVRSCRHNPRADNMMLRLVVFDQSVTEIHGFKPLTDCNEADYSGCIQIGGNTALYDAAYTGIKSVTQYARDLSEQDFSVNAALFVITDGADNQSKVTPSAVAAALREAVTSETLESITAVLIGINTGANGGLNSYLQCFKDQAGFSQYVAIAKANEKTLAQLGQFVSRSISAQSQALGTGGSSQSLSF